MPLQLNWLGTIVSLKAPNINVQMLNAYQARPDYEAITLLPDAGQALCTGGRIAGQPGARWKPLAPPQLAMDFDFRAGMGKLETVPIPIYMVPQQEVSTKKLLSSPILTTS